MSFSRKKKDDGNVDYVDILLHKNNRNGFGNYGNNDSGYDEQLPLTQDPAVRRIIIIGLILGLVAAYFIIFRLESPQGAESSFEYTSKSIDDDAELEAALANPEIFTYRLSNISFTATEVPDDFGVIANSFEFWRLDYKCQAYIKQQVRHRRHGRRHSYYGHDYYNEEVRLAPCEDPVYTTKSTITIAGHTFEVGPRDYQTPGTGREFPLTTFDGYEQDLFDYNKFEDEHELHKNDKHREIYQISGIPKKATVNFWASVGNGKLSPIPPSSVNEATFYFGNTSVFTLREPLITRNKILVFTEGMILATMLLCIWYVRSREIY